MYICEHVSQSRVGISITGSQNEVGMPQSGMETSNPDLSESGVQVLPGKHPLCVEAGFELQYMSLVITETLTKLAEVRYHLPLSVCAPFCERERLPFFVSICALYVHECLCRGLA